MGTGYGFITLYYGLQLIADLNVSFGLQNLWDIGFFIAQITITSLLLGVFFEFPMILFVLSKLGMVSKQHLKKGRRLAYAVIIIVVALLPPTDGISLVVMSLPLLLLYELSVLLSNHTKRMALSPL
jgi:sec-independent protein translocase protein TatC